MPPAMGVMQIEGAVEVAARTVTPRASVRQPLPPPATALAATVAAGIAGAVLVRPVVAAAAVLRGPAVAAAVVLWGPAVAAAVVLRGPAVAAAAVCLASVASADAVATTTATTVLA